MNGIIKQQLLKIKSVKLDFNDDTKNILIKRTTTFDSNLLSIGDTVKLEVLNNNVDIKSEAFSIVKPKYKLYIAEIIDRNLNLTKVNAVPIIDGEYIYSENMFGWLPNELFKVIEKL